MTGNSPRVRPVWRPEWSKGELEAALKKYSSGYAVAKAWDVHRDRIYRALDYWKIPRGHRVKPKVFEIDVETLREAYDHYGSCCKIAESYGVSHSTVLRKMKQYGLDRHRLRTVGQVRLCTVKRWISMMGRGKDQDVFDEMCAIVNEKEEAIEQKLQREREKVPCDE